MYRIKKLLFTFAVNVHVPPGCCSASTRAFGCSPERNVLVVPVDFKGRSNWVGAGKPNKGSEGHRRGMGVAVDAGGQPKHDLL